jgi:3-deoxy-D-manno-octulosonic-acid transferase
MRLGLALVTLCHMRWLMDFLYLIAAILTLPVWLYRLVRTGKIRTDWPARMGKTQPLPTSTRPRILLHAVSVGEVNAIRMLVDQLASANEMPEIVIAATTDTGIARARELWGQRFRVVRYPFDFSPFVNRFLRALVPDLVVLVELEVWPNFVAACSKRRIPIVVVNGRLTERSFRRYRRIQSMVRPMFRRLTVVAAQNTMYANHFVALGADASAMHITGTMKWDTAQIAEQVPGAEELAREMGIDRNKPLVVAGSTALDEHRLIHNAIPPGVQLLCAPRKPEWFDQAAIDLPNCVRRSHVKNGQSPTATDRFLLDTIGELRKAYALADVVVIGRSFGGLHGSDMMEPVALGKPTIVGPAVADFQDTVDALLAGGALVQTTAEQLPRTLCELLQNPVSRSERARNGRQVIQAQQGATQKNARIILNVLEQSRKHSSAKNPPSQPSGRDGGGGEEERH